MPKQLEVGEQRQWFRVSAKQGNTAEVFIYDEIGKDFFGLGVAAEELIQQIKGLGLGSSDELKVRINSPGGNFFEAMAVHSYLGTLKARVTATIDGVAASAAAYLAMAAQRIEMPENTFFFIHNPLTIVKGDFKVMEKAAEDLKQMRDSAAAMVLRKTGDKLPRSKLIEMMQAETWMSAADSLKVGMADFVGSPVRAAALAQFDLSKYGSVPTIIASAKSAAAEESKRERARIPVLKNT